MTETRGPRDVVVDWTGKVRRGGHRGIAEVVPNVRAASKGVADTEPGLPEDKEDGDRNEHFVEEMVEMLSGVTAEWVMGWYCLYFSCCTLRSSEGR